MPQVIKKRKIVIASVLKPVDDTRMFGKIGQSLANMENVEIHIFGYTAATPPSFPNVFFHPHKPFKRLSLKRLMVPWKVLTAIRNLQPDFFITTTHELLLTGLLLKAISGVRLLYDIQENYFRNLAFTRSFPVVVGQLLAIYVRIKELIAAFFIDHFFLAEEGYRKELKFVQNKFTVLENKVKQRDCVPSSVDKPHPHFQLLFSGTLAESTGVFIAIHLAKELHKVDPTIRLAIIGYCAQRDTLEKLNQEIQPYDFITLTGGNKLVPHSAIIHAIHTSHFGIISYPSNPSTYNTMPTKLYEYLGCKLPVLLINHDSWINRCKPYPAAVVFDPHQMDAPDLLQSMKTTRFFVHAPGPDLYWESESEKLLKIVQNLSNR